MKVLITGGAGFVGRHFTVRLLEEGHEVTVVDPIVEGTGGQDPNREQWFVGNPLDYINFTFLKEDCRKYFLNHASDEFDLIIHLAAIVGGRLVIERNPLAIVEDLEIDSAFWRWTKGNTTSHLISFSSSAAYPIEFQTFEFHRALVEDDIIFENQIGMHDLTYGWAKLTSEYIGQLAHQKYGTKVASYRPFSGYGEDQDLTYPFPAIMKRAVETNVITLKHFEVWGTGKQERDFIHIEDIVSMVLNSYKNLVDGSALNLGTGIATNFISLAGLALGILNIDLPVKGLSTMPEGVFSRVANTDKAREYGLIHSINLNSGVSRGLDYWLKQAPR